ncbi:MAG: rhombosortase [Gammaproteobacteria bacterium]|nr:rhombosortase [Gammaproteobacteria bacterium]
MRRISAWFVPAAAGLVCLVISLAGERGRVLLRYDREAIADGEAWRLLTGHFTHLGITHMLLNVAGLLLVWLLVGLRCSSRQWILIALMTIAGINSGFWFIDLQLKWYVGLSGLLHGLLVAGALAGMARVRTESLIILAAVGLKLVWEQLAGPLPGSEASAGGNVIVNAHLYGALAGAAAAAFIGHSARSTPAI